MTTKDYQRKSPIMIFLHYFKNHKGLFAVDMFCALLISAVDLLKGIAVGTGMRVIDVPGANGSLHTNYEGKARAAVKALLEEIDAEKKK